jgi:DNA polymerase III delta prime subunit
MSRELFGFTDISHIRDEFDPTSLAEVVFPSERTEIYLKRWVSRSTTTRNLLLYGSPGTGKTRAAYQLARARTDGTEEWDPIKYRECESGIADKLLQQLKDEVFAFPKTCHPKFESVVILDEVDNFKPDQQKHLKKVMERSDLTFILLTNHINRLDEGIKDRCYAIPWQLPNFEGCKERIRVLTENAGHRDLDETILRRIYTSAGWRQILRNIETLSID